MALHHATFDYLKPTEEQLEQMDKARRSARDYIANIETLMPDGPDKTYVLRKAREVAMWVNVAITRGPDGSPRS